MRCAGEKFFVVTHLSTDTYTVCRDTELGKYVKVRYQGCCKCNSAGTDRQKYPGYVSERDQRENKGGLAFMTKLTLIELTFSGRLPDILSSSFLKNLTVKIAPLR